MWGWGSHTWLRTFCQLDQPAGLLMQSFHFAFSETAGKEPMANCADRFVPVDFSLPLLEAFKTEL